VLIFKVKKHGDFKNHHVLEEQRLRANLWPSRSTQAAC